MARGTDGWVSEVYGVQIPVTVEMIDRVWDIPVRGIIVDYLADRIEGFGVYLSVRMFVASPL